MYLSDRTLRNQLSLILPKHREEAVDPEVQIQPASIDLRLGYDFIIPRADQDTHFRIIKPKVYSEEVEVAVVDTYGVSFTDGPGGKPYVVLEAGVLLLATTIETVHVPDNMLARVDGRSSLGRKGIRIHSTAGFIDPGFTGRITLEIDVVARTALYPGQRVCQISFALLDGRAERPYGHETRRSKYQGQGSVTASRLEDDE